MTEFGHSLWMLISSSPTLVHGACRLER